jgi:3-oxoacyl-[acyl-carrier protein] reductase
MTKPFTGRKVLITGAAGGMGRALATRFGGAGAQLILTDIDQTGLDEAATALRQDNVQCETYVVDLAEEGDIQRFAKELCLQHPQLDVLINNAGMAYGEVAHGFAELSQEKWLRFLSINSLAPLMLAQALREPLAQAKGVIINITSMASNMPGTAYGVTKATLNAITYGMAGTFGAEGIRVNGIAPGLMETPAALEQLPEGTLERIQSMQMLPGVKGSPEDIAELAAFLASDQARFIHCEIVSCDAGNRVRGWRG